MIPAALPLLISRFPGLTIVLLQGDSREVLGKLMSEEVEFAVVGGRFAEDSLEFTSFARDELVLIAPAGHRWSGGRNPRPRERRPPSPGPPGRIQHAFLLTPRGQWPTQP
jgi:DNA-binding transcriptional LysR family regulator